MALKGKAAVIIRLDRPETDLAEYYTWQNGEHFPERLSIPGFQRGRRFRSIAGPRYLTVYEADNMAVLTGPHYLARLNNPTPLTRKVAPRSLGMMRGDCQVEFSQGQGAGGAMASIFLWAPAANASLLRGALTTTLLPKALSAPEILAAHLCSTNAAASTAEVTERKGRDIRVPDWVVLIEGVSPGAVAAASTQLSDDTLRAAGVEGHIERDTYTLEMSLDPLWAGAK
jgi:hypothetical protein